VLLEGGLQALTSARDDEIDETVGGRDLAQLVAVAARHERDRPGLQPRRFDSLDRDGRQRGVRVRGHRRPAQDDRVAGLDAQRGAVDRHVRTCLVDDGDDPHRDEHLLEPDPIRQRALLDDLADRVGQGRDVAHVARDSDEPLLGELEPVEQRGGEPALATGLHVALVRLEDLGRAVRERVGKRLEGTVLRLGIERGEPARGSLRLRADVGNGGCRGGHSLRGYNRV
jgi:hypothetical protein